MESPSRIYYLDAAKVLAMFLVVYGHLFTGDSKTDLYLYGFHLPCFYLISGIFHSFRGIIQWRKYFITLIWPAFIFFVITLLFSTVHGIILSDSNRFSEGIDFLKASIYGLVAGNGVGVYWFLIALFWCKIMMDIALLIPLKWVSFIIWALLLLVPHLFHFHLPLLISNAIMAMPFYVAGSAGRSVFKTRKTSWGYLLIILVCLIGTILLSRLNGKVSMVGVYFGNLPYNLSIPVFYLNGFIGSVMVLGISLLPIPELRIVKKLAPALITIVGIQGILITIYTDLFGKNNSFVFSFAMTCFIILLCWIAHYYLSKLYAIPNFKHKQ